MLSHHLFFSVVIAFINGYSVKLATHIQNICTVVKLLAIAIITIGGIVRIAQGMSFDSSFVCFLLHREKVPHVLHVHMREVEKKRINMENYMYMRERERERESCIYIHRVCLFLRQP